MSHDYTSETQRIISFCTGYGGIELGLRGAGLDARTVCYVEIETYAQANLVAKIEEGKMAPAPIWTDIKTFPSQHFSGNIHGIIGGYPCQPFSAAGQRKGTDDPRHLWPYIKGAIESIRPRWCFFENVEGHLTLGLKDVMHDLGELGYETTAGLFSASEVGAPHQRKRLFILAHCKRLGFRGGESSGSCGDDKQGIQAEKTKQARCDVRGEAQGCSGEIRKLAHSECERSQGYAGDVDREGRPGARESGSTSESSLPLWPARPKEDQYDWEEPRILSDSNLPGSERLKRDGHESENKKESKGHEPCSRGEAQSGMGSSIDGFNPRVDQLRLLGNGVVPQTATLAFKTLWKSLAQD
jgi:DNA (cytosine-5)-methyltransferase 1